MAYIMVVDDDEDLADFTAKILKGEGHEVAVYPEIKMASGEIRKRRPDLLILDVMFPESASAGFEFSRKLSQEAPGLRILMLTAVNAHFEIEFSSRDIDPEWMPVSDFLEKPVESGNLKRTVARLLAGNPDGGKA